MTKSTKSNTIKKGSKVNWKWGKGTASGTVTEVHNNKTTKSIKGSNITRNASRPNPALTIKQASGQTVLKSKREVKSTNK